MANISLSPELTNALGIEDFTLKKENDRNRGTTPILSEAQINAVDKLNQQLNAKVSSKMKRNNDDDEEVLANFDLRSAPRAILHQGPLMKRSINSIVQHNTRRYGYLLNDVLLITSPPPSSSSGKISLHQVIYLDTISVVDLKSIDPAEDSAAFEIRTADRPYQLIAEKETEKLIWIEEITATIYCLMASRMVKTLGWHLKMIRGSIHSAAFLGDIDLLQKLVQSLPIPDKIDELDESGMTPLHWACVAGQLECVRLLLDHGADIDALNGGLNSPLLLAAAMGKHSVVLFLLNYGADIEVRNLKDFDCLLMAIVFGNYTTGLYEAVQVLKLRGLDINKQDLSGATPLHQCTARNLPASIQILVDVGADVNAKHGRSGLTPLQLACTGQCPEAETVRILLDKGAMPNWKDVSNQTAFNMLLATHKTNMAAKFADTSSSDGMKAAVDEIGEFCTNVLPVLQEIVRKGGRFEVEAIAHLRESFQETINACRQQWLQAAEPSQFGDFLRSRDESSSSLLSNDVKWTADNASQSCLMCLDKFTLSNRRHHCRCCGILCCDVCSSKRIKLPIIASATKVTKGKAEGERVCDCCFNRLLFSCSEWNQALNMAKKVQRKIEESLKEEMERREVLTLKSPASTGSMNSMGGKSPMSSTGKSIGAANAAANETLKVLEERGEKMSEVAEKSEQLKNAASDFHKMTRTLHQQLQAKSNIW
eukprot:gene2216-2420_t